MTARENTENLRHYKNTFFLTVRVYPGFCASSTNLVREVNSFTLEAKSVFQNKPLIK